MELLLFFKEVADLESYHELHIVADSYLSAAT